MNPGEHQVRFTLDPHPPVVHTVLIADGMKFRLVSAEFWSDAPAEEEEAELAAPARRGPPWSGRAAPTRSVPDVVYPLAGLGVVALGSFVAFTISGNAEYDRLSRSCAPFCSDDELRPVRTRYLLGDVSLGVSVLSLAGAAILYFTRPALSPVAPPIGLAPLRNGGMATFTLETE